jgi:Tol biopolymer transport system component
MTRRSATLLLAAVVTIASGAALPSAWQVPPSPQAPAQKPAADQKKLDKNELPLDGVRKLEFETDEGTWMSLDVTPDGKSIVFELLGDLYTLPASGGDATRLTQGMPFDAQPRVSPDGKWIAFISDRNGSDNLWIAKIDGTEPRKLTNEAQDPVISPAWTPDSNYVIATVRGTRTELRMFHINGGTGIALGSAPAPAGGGATPPGGAATPARLGASVSPDGRYLFVAQAEGAGGRGAGAFPRWQIARLDMRSGDVDVITQAEGSGIRPLVSPDGKLLVYGTRHETRTGLRVRDLSTGADRWLKWPVTRDEQETGGSPSRDTFPGYAFTPDSKELIVTSDGKLHRVNIASGESRVTPFKARVSLDVGPDLEFPYKVPQGSVRAKLIQDPAQSPDGRRLAASVLTKIYVMDLPKTQPQRLTSGEAWEFKPAWSPDGQWIAYVTWSMGGGHIWKTRADGSGQPQQLTKVAAFYTDIVFSPDGQRIVGLRGNEYMRQQTFSEFGGLRIPLDLVWLPAAGGDVELIVPARGVGTPHFTQDPDRIFVYSNDGLISLRYDGTDRRTHLRVTGPGRSGAPRPPAADAVIMRPDGKWALASVNNQLWIVAVPPYTGTTPSIGVRSPSLPAKRLTDVGADYFGWADGGKTLAWAIGSTFFRRPFASVDFTPAEPAGGRGAGGGAAGADAPKDEKTEQDKKAEEAKKKDPLDLDKNVEAIDVSIELPRAMPKGTIALRHATVITMGKADVVKDADVVVTDNRIVQIGRSGSVKIPAGAREIDARGKFIVPGFVDTHAHWEFRTHDVLEPQNWSLVANLAYGVTAGLDVQTSTNDYFAYQDLVETGQSLGQRAFMTGPGVFSSNDFQSYEATLAYLRRYKQHYRTPNIKSYMVGNRKQRQWVVQAAKELQLMPTTEGGRDLKLDMTHAVDGMHGNEHTLPVFPLYKDVVELFAQTKTAYTPTLLVNYGGIIAEEYFYTTTEVHDDKKLNRFYPHNVLDDMTRRRRVWARKDEFVFPDAAASAAKIQRAGGLVGVGGHGQLQGLGYHWEMWALAMGGMTPREVLKAATIDGAKIIGFDEDLGSIDVGKLADLVVLDRNPLDDIRNTNTIRYVMKNGELFEGDTLTQIWPVRKELPRFWWWEAGPKITTETNGRRY